MNIHTKMQIECADDCVTMPITTMTAANNALKALKNSEQSWQVKIDRSWDTKRTTCDSDASHGDHVSQNLTLVTYHKEQEEAIRCHSWSRARQSITDILQGTFTELHPDIPLTEVEKQWVAQTAKTTLKDFDLFIIVEDFNNNKQVTILLEQESKASGY